MVCGSPKLNPTEKNLIIQCLISLTRDNLNLTSFLSLMGVLIKKIAKKHCPMDRAINTLSGKDWRD